MTSDILSLHQVDVGHNKFLTMDIDTGDHPHTVQKLYTIPLKHTQWVWEDIETLEKAGIISSSVSPWLSLIVIMGEQPKNAYV